MAQHPTRSNPADDGTIAVAFPDQARKAHSADFNDLQAIQQHQVRGIADAILSDGDVVSGGAIVIVAAAGDLLAGDRRRVRLGAGKIYAQGRVHEVAARDIDIDAVGRLAVGLCLHTEIVTHIEDPRLVGDIAGTRAHGEPMMDRRRITARWKVSNDLCDGDFFAVYHIADGELVTPPQPIAAIDDRIRLYDLHAHGHYIVQGWAVSALGLREARQHFGVSAGTVNVLGYKIRRDHDQRLVIDEQPDVQLVDAEPHDVPSDGSRRIFVNHAPITSVAGVIVYREVPTPITRGPFAGGADPLYHDGVSSIVSITQGATTYVAGVDFSLHQDRVDWSLPGAEPAPGSTYDIVYRYLDTVEPDVFDGVSVTLPVGVAPGTSVIVTYRYALPRIDAIAVDRFGALHYLKGVSVRHAPWPPRAPSELFVLAEVVNRWGQTPLIRSTKTRAYHNNEVAALFETMADGLQLLALERLKVDADRRDPAAKRGVFVDNLIDDDLRDQGTPQTGAVFGSKLRLPIAGVTRDISLGPVPLMLPYVEEVVLQQPLRTGTVRVNPYQVFAPLPGALTLTPAVDFWTEEDTDWASDVTRVFDEGARAGGGNTTTATVEEIARRRRALPTLRVRDVAFTLSGFGAGEQLDRMTFDGLVVVPAAPVAADANGRLVGTFAIPAGIAAGAKRVVALGKGGTAAATVYIGSGEIETRTLQRVFTTAIWRDLPVPTPAPVAGGDFSWDFGSFSGGGNDGGAGSEDPQAQTFRLSETRHITSVEVRLGAIGNRDNPIVAQIRDTQDGHYPTAGVRGEGVLDMHATVAGSWATIALKFPAVSRVGITDAIVIMTDDGLHELGVAERTKFDPDAQQWVTANPLEGSVNLDSSTQTAWVAHHDRDLTFRLKAARFTASSRRIEAGTLDLVAVTDLVIHAGVDLPTADTSVLIEITRANGAKLRVQPGQPIRFDVEVTEQVTVAVLLAGTALHSPVVYPILQVHMGRIATTADYVSRAVVAGPQTRVVVTLDCLLPGQSAAVVEIGKPGAWMVAPLVEVSDLGEGVQERTYEADFAGADVQTRLALTGTTAHRPTLANVRMIAKDRPTNITA